MIHKIDRTHIIVHSVELPPHSLVFSPSNTEGLTPLHRLNDRVYNLIGNEIDYNISATSTVFDSLFSLPFYCIYATEL